MISVVCPTFNEIRYLPALCEHLLEMAPVEKELIFVDGGSTDGTWEFLCQLRADHPCIRVLRNPQRTVPYALNLGVEAATGDVIVRIDAHTRYADDYFEKILETFRNIDADIVGGPTRTAAHSHLQEVVGHAISSRLGIGNSRVHDESYRGYSDSVTFGAWRRSLFRDVGMFDERLRRNQDDEFHYRARSLGKKIYQNPDIRLYYYPRDRIETLFQQYFEYGMYKPLVLRNVRSEAKLRHLIPSLFALYVMTLPGSATISTASVVPLLIYGSLIGFDVLMARWRGKRYGALILVYPTIHLAYGLGFLKGIFGRLPQ